MKPNTNNRLSGFGMGTDDIVLEGTTFLLVPKHNLGTPSSTLCVEHSLNEFSLEIRFFPKIGFLESPKSSNLTGFENLSGFFCP
jgi:hypothetical protein